MEQHAGTGVEHREAGGASQRRSDAHRAGDDEQYRPADGRDKDRDPPPASKYGTDHDQSRDHRGLLPVSTAGSVSACRPPAVMRPGASWLTASSLPNYDSVSYCRAWQMPGRRVVGGSGGGRGGGGGGRGAGGSRGGPAGGGGC